MTGAALGCPLGGGFGALFHFADADQVLLGVRVEFLGEQLRPRLEEVSAMGATPGRKQKILAQASAGLDDPMPARRATGVLQQSRMPQLPKVD